MITKFKLFEALNEGKPEKGDYVLAKIDNPIGEELIKLNDFLQNHIAQITGYDLGRAILQFSESSKDHVINCHFDRDRFSDDMRRYSDLKDITHWSKNKEDLEDFLAAKKYNL